MNDTDLAARLSAVEARLRELEDVEQIRQLLTEYGFNADLGRVDDYLAAWTDDCTYEQGAGKALHGKAELASIIAPSDSPHKLLLENRSQHVVTNFAIRVDGDEGWVECYSFVLYLKDGAMQIWSAAYNDWDVRREGGSWKIVRRRRRAIGAEGHGSDIIGRYLNARP